ncbi:polysaccharide deacetylase [Paenibacillus puerhi]|uniref:polysaccharide deacetylase n=1 Tax=Paenibacillus puerhi TaxID=2692622 RepID=UPI001359A74A|nr:polysaccharide deacetylase [Paenibacillus puerhi]
MRELRAQYRKFWKVFMLVVLAGALVGSVVAPQGAYAAGAEAASPSDETLFSQLSSGKRMDQERPYVTPEEPTVYLTFDDGPSGLTPQVLDILKQEDVKATFFVLGEQAEAQPDTVKRIVREGHAIGNHTFDHVYKELYAGFDSFWEQVQRTEDVVYGLTGVSMRLVRAPGGSYGNFDPFYYYYLSEAGYSVHDWSIDSEDSRAPRRTAAQLLGTVAGGPLGHEVTVLLHDGAGHQATVQALPGVIAYFKEKGYSFAPLTEEVKPVQQSVGRSKWGRSVSLKSFLVQRQAMREHRLAWGEESEAAPSQPVLQPQLALVASRVTPEMPQRLAVQVDGIRVDYASDGFRFSESRFEVPLRRLAEAIGAEVRWSEEARTATVRYGAQVVEYDLAQLQVRRHRPGAFWLEPGQAMWTRTLPDMELKEGSLYVPLRGLLELLGIHIQSYEAESGEQPARVMAASRGRFSIETIFTAWKPIAQRAKV